MSDRPAPVKCVHCGNTFITIPVLRIHMYLEHGLDYKERKE